MLNISENHRNSLRALAHVIERKLLDMQMVLLAHRNQIRFVRIKYMNLLTEEEAKKIEESILKMYDLLEKFCSDYNIPSENANLRNELIIKANFLWEDISGAATKNLRGYGGGLYEDLKNDYELKITDMVNAANNLINQLN